MKKALKTEYIILGVVIVALGLYLGLRSSDRAHYELPEVKAIEAGKITKVELQGQKATVTLQKQNARWVLGSEKYAADADRVKEILAPIEGLTLAALVAESKNDVRYDLGEDKRIGVKAWVGDDLERDFAVGKAASSYQHTYVKIAGDDKVYQANKNLRTALDHELDDLRDKMVMKLEADSITRIQIKDGEQELVLELKADQPAEVKAETDAQKSDDKANTAPAPAKWVSADGREADRGKIDSLLSALSKLKCGSYIYDRTKADFKTPIYTLSLKGAQSYSLDIFAAAKEDAADLPAISSESDSPFNLPTWQTDDIKITPEDFFPTEEKKVSE